MKLWCPFNNLCMLYSRFFIHALCHQFVRIVNMIIEENSYDTFINQYSQIDLIYTVWKIVNFEQHSFKVKR